MWDPFTELTTKWGPQFSYIFTSSWLVFKFHLYLVASHRQLTFKHESSLYSRLVSEGGIYPFPMVPYLRRRFVTSSFFETFSNTVVIYPRLADLQRVLWQGALRSTSCSRDSVCFFLLLFSSLSLSLCLSLSIYLSISLSLSLSLSLSPSPEITPSRSLSNFDSPYHITFFLFT